MLINRIVFYRCRHSLGLLHLQLKLGWEKRRREQTATTAVLSMAGPIIVLAAIISIFSLQILILSSEVVLGCC
jgi:hypothetical protein